MPLAGYLPFNVTVFVHIAWVVPFGSFDYEKSRKRSLDLSHFKSTDQYICDGPQFELLDRKVIKLNV